MSFRGIALPGRLQVVYGPFLLQIFTRCLAWSRQLEEKMEERKKAREEAGTSDDDDDDEDDDDEDLYKLQELSSSELSPELTASEYRVFVDVSI